MLRLRSLALMMMCALAVTPLSAQSYETAFTEPTFDTAKAPKDIFGDVKVDPATGRATMDIPMGPGIGGRGAVYQPTLRMRESYIHTYQQQIYEWYLGFPIAIPWQIGDDGHLEGFDGQNLDSSTGWSEVHGGESTQSLLPGYFTLGLPREPALRGWDRTSQFEVSGQSGVLNTNSPLPSSLSAAAVLTKFGYDSTVTVGAGPGFQLLAGPPTGQFMQMASNRYLVMALTGGAMHQYDAKTFQDSYYTGQATQASYPYWVPGAFLVVDKDVAYEFTFAYTKADTGSYLQTAGGDTMKPATFMGHGVYRLSRILNAFGDQITFTYGATPGVATSQITTHWIRNGADTGMGVTLTAGAQGGISVAYTGLPQNQPISYTVGTAGGMWGSWISYDQDHQGFWEGCLTTNIPALPDQSWAQIPVSSVVQDQTQERIDFKAVNGLPSVVYSRTGSAPTRTVSLHWSPETPFFMTQKANKPYPGRAWTIGVDRVDDIVPGPNGAVTRSTTYSRTIPVPNTWLSAQNDFGQYSWVADPNGTVLANPVGWPAGSVSSCKVTHPDGRWVLYTYAPPSTSNFGMDYLLFVKNFPIKEEWHGSDDSLEKTVTYSNYDAHSPGNPAGTGLNPVPVATHWEIQDYLAGRWEIHDLNPATAVSGVGWDATNLGWTGEQVLIKDLNGNLISDRTVGRTLTSQMGVFLYGQGQADTPVDPTVRIPVSRTYANATTNLIATATYGNAGGPQVTLHTDWATGTGLLTDAWLDYAGVGTPTYGAKYTYDANGFMKTLAPIAAAYANLSVSQVSNGVGWPVSQTDANGLTKGFTWDGAGRLMAQSLPNNELGHGFAYDPGAQTVTVSRGVQNETHYYNGFGDPIRITRKNGDGSTSHRAFGYDTAGHLIWETVWRAGDGASVDWTSPLGPDDTSVTTPGWTEVTSQCAAWSVPDMDGNRTCLRYRTIVHPAVTVTTFSGSTHYTYDDHGRVTQVRDPNQEITTTDYAALSTGSTKTVTLAPGTAAQKQQTDSYDALGRLVKVTAISDSGPLDSVYTYDNADRVKSVTQWSGIVGTGPSQVRSWTYDSLGRLTTLVQPESGTTTYSNFLPTGKPQTTVYGSGSASPKTLTTSYDAVGRILSVTSSDGSVTQGFSYDQAGHGLANGKLTSATSNGVGRSLIYNGLNGRLSSLVRTVDGRTFTQSMGYDASYGFLISRTYPDGKVQMVGFDPARNLPTTTTFYGSSLAGFTYDPTSWMPVQITYANAATTGFSYGPDQARLASMTHTIPGVSPTVWAFSYNEAGELGTDGEDWYSHDKLGRLTGAFMRDPMDPTAGHGLQQTFSYDAFGNRTGMTSQKVTNWTAATAPPGSPTLAGLASDPRALRSFSMTTAEVTTMAATNHVPATLNGVTTGAAYDAQGNLTAIYEAPGASASQLTMTYDALGRVATLGDTAHATSQTYGFDDEGLRIKSLDSATGLTKYSIYDEARHLIAQYEVPSGGSLTLKRDILYVGDKEVAERDSAGKTWVQFLDHLGSPRLAWDGTAVSTVDNVHLIAQKFAPFGEALNTTSAAKFAKGFTNHEQTDPSGLIYMQARFYAPMYGRFLSPDPARDQHFEQTQSWNIYSYVQNDPTMRVDPTGMQTAADASSKTSDEEARKKAQAQAQTTNVSYTFQATAAIHEDTVTGPGVTKDALGGPVIAQYAGDGANRSFDTSNNIDQGSTRITLVFNVNLTLTNGNLTGISTSVSPVSGASPSHEEFPESRTGLNTLNSSVTSSLNGARGASVSFSASAHNSLAPGSELAPIRINGEIHFSSTGAYQGMKGSTSGYPWIQVRGFTGGRAIDNVMVSPAIRAPLIGLWQTMQYQSGYWR